jgi:hypothetical protein
MVERGRGDSTSTRKSRRNLRPRARRRSVGAPWALRGRSVGAPWALRRRSVGAPSALRGRSVGAPWALGGALSENAGIASNRPSTFVNLSFFVLRPTSFRANIAAKPAKNVFCGSAGFFWVRVLQLGMVEELGNRETGRMPVREGRVSPLRTASLVPWPVPGAVSDSFGSATFRPVCGRERGPAFSREALHGQEVVRRQSDLGLR